MYKGALMHETRKMRKRLTLGIALLAIQGCATHVVSSNERSVTVDSYWMHAARAQELADAECAKHSRIAQMSSKTDPWESYVFYCIDRDTRTAHDQRMLRAK
jgi:hypothetical protein